MLKRKLYNMIGIQWHETAKSWWLSIVSTYKYRLSKKMVRNSYTKCDALKIMLFFKELTLLSRINYILCLYFTMVYPLSIFYYGSRFSVANSVSFFLLGFLQITYLKLEAVIIIPLQFLKMLQLPDTLNVINKTK